MKTSFRCSTHIVSFTATERSGGRQTIPAGTNGAGAVDIFLAFEGSRAIGFNQLYPSFSSGALARIFILNDLFVEPDSRRSGAGTELLAQAAKYGRAQGAVRLVLSTEATNTHAQALYERCGWTHDTAFLTYQFRL